MLRIPKPLVTALSCVVLFAVSVDVHAGDGLRSDGATSFKIAQAKKGKSKSAKTPSENKPVEKKQPAAKAQAAEVAVPNGEKSLLLIRTVLLTLNDALQTGNFTVLRDRASPSFYASNTAADLSQIFRNLRQRRIDLSSVSVLAPKLKVAPTIDKQQRLRLTGFFPGNPVQINFDLLFEPVQGQWRLFGISVNPTASGAATGAVSQPAPAAEKAADKKK